MKLLVLLLLFPLYAFAGESWLTLPIASYHADRSREAGKGKYNQQNLGLGLEYALNERWKLGAGIYRNSIRTDTGYVGVAYMPYQLGPVRIGTSAGLASGYAGNLMPVLVPTAALEWKGLGLNTLFIPPYDGKPAGLGFQLKVRLP